LPQIVQAGSINTTALIVPDLYVQIVPPQNLNLNGVPTNVIGVVGSASWGPVDVPSIFGNASQYATTYGPVMARMYDMGTQVATAIQQGAAAFVGVRVTDGTDTAAMATTTAGGGAVMFTALYTGSQGNTTPTSGLTVNLMTGSAPNSWQVVVAMPGFNPEIFNNIPGPPAGATAAELATFWMAVVSAINTGTASTSASQLIVASYDSTAVAAMPMAATFAFAGGTDGATGVDTSTEIGDDVSPYKGMYCLQNQGVSVVVLADSVDTTQYTTQAAFGYQIGAYMILTGPMGDTIANAVATKAAVGLDDYSCKLMFGDWLWWNDQTNNVQRLVSPQGFAAGRLGNLSPEQSSLNKEIYSVVASQSSGPPGSAQLNSYSTIELQTLISAGIDVICNPQPGGSYWGCRSGHNSSTNAAIQGDNYTRLTNYIAATLAAGMGAFVGMLITPTLLQQIGSTLLAFFGNMLQAGQLNAQPSGAVPYSVICNATNNPLSMTSLGYVQANANVTYSAINEKFLVNLQGGQTVVQPSTATTQPNYSPATPTF
jgi:hypothetical protein